MRLRDAVRAALFAAAVPTVIAIIVTGEWNPAAWGPGILPAVDACAFCMGIVEALALIARKGGG
jgi:hypothetical protein